MAETGRLIYRRYLLQRLLKQGQVCTVYQGFDQVLQRAVAVKIAPAEHVTAYRAAIRATANFSHPNITGIYDLVVEPDRLYIVQEYVDGDDFSTLLQMSLTPYQIVDLGIQICQALLYASSTSRKICHGDLTPAAITRDRRGSVHVNNFALPSDLYYFTGWSTVGGDGVVISDRELPWGQLSAGRRDDDTRAVGILLYQLLSGRAPGATVVEPPADGRLRFSRNIPAELCEVVARTIARAHPQHISTADTLLTELRKQAEALEPPAVIAPVPPAVNPYQTENMPPPSQFSPSPSSPGTGKLVTALPAREAGLGFPAFRSEAIVQAPALEQASPIATPSYAEPTIAAEAPINLASARQAAYPQSSPGLDVRPRRLNVSLMLLSGLILFALFFVAGFFLAHALLFAH
jgi:serine/threonine protein kinase